MADTEWVWMDGIEADENWAEMTYDQHVARAQWWTKQLAAYQRGQRGLIRTIPPVELSMAQMHLQMAQTKAIDALSWTLENRIASGISTAIWEGLRQR